MGNRHIVNFAEKLQSVLVFSQHSHFPFRILQKNTLISYLLTILEDLMLTCQMQFLLVLPGVNTIICCLSSV